MITDECATASISVKKSNCNNYLKFNVSDKILSRNCKKCKSINTSIHWLFPRFPSTNII